MLSRGTDALEVQWDTLGCKHTSNLHPRPFAATTRQLDICGEITTVSDCSGVISDGIGPYADSLDCGVRLNGYIGSTYTLTFDEFETQQDVDFPQSVRWTIIHCSAVGRAERQGNRRTDCLH